MRILLVREAGGLGDIIMTLGAARALKNRYPSASLEYLTLPEYAPLLAAEREIDIVHTVARDKRREPNADVNAQGYITKLGLSRDDKIIDFYCPAYAHELKTTGNVTKSRLEIFSNAAGVPTTRAKLNVSDNLTRNLRQQSLHSKNSRSHIKEHLIGIAPYSTNLNRSITDSQKIKNIVAQLNESNSEVVFFNSWREGRPGRIEVSARELGAIDASCCSYPNLFAWVNACDAVLTCDTGIMHIAGALGIPSVGIFGATSGEVISRPYRFQTWLSGSAKHAKCTAPCYLMESRGFCSNTCGQKGCERIADVSENQILEAINNILKNL